MEEDILVEVPEQEIPNVLHAMKKDWPNHFLLYQMITIMEEYRTANLKTPTQTLYRYGNIDEGVYVLRTRFTIEPEPFTYFFIYTTSKELTDMSKVLAESSRIPWSGKHNIFEITLSRFSPVAHQILALKRLSFRTHKVFLMFVPPEESIEVKELPDDVFKDWLDESHIAEVNKNWPYKTRGTDLYLGQQLSSNFGLGIFRKSDKKMLCSSLSLHCGGIFILFTDPAFRGRGYAEFLVRCMVKEIRQRGRIPFCTIVTDNIPSMKLFKKIGFKDFSQAEFIY